MSVLLCLSQLVCVQVACGSALDTQLVQAEPTSADIGFLTRQVAKKEVELLRLNTNYRMQSTRVSKWKVWRTFFWNMGLFACTNAGIDHVAYARWKTWQRPATARKDFLISGPILLLTGHAIAVGGVLVESAFDLLDACKTRRRGFDSKAMQRRVAQLKLEIEKAIALRDAAIANHTELAEQDRQVLTAEGDVLRDVKDAALVEYSRFNIRASKWRAKRDTSNLMVFSQASTGGFIGSLFSLLAASNRKPKLAGTAGIGFTTSGACVVMIPLMTKLTAFLAGKDAAHRTAGILDGVNPKAPAAFDADREHLASLLASTSANGYVLKTLADRATVYQLENDVLDAQTAILAGESRQSNRDLMERTLVLGAIGGTKMGYGIQLCNAGFGFRKHPPLPAITVPLKFGGVSRKVPLPKPKGSNELFSKRVAQAATTFVPGPALGLVDTLQNRVRSELSAYELRRKGGSPGQALKQRLDSLDKMEEILDRQLKAGSPIAESRAGELR